MQNNTCIALTTCQLKKVVTFFILFLSFNAVQGMEDQQQQASEHGAHGTIVPFMLESQEQTLDMNEVDCLTQSKFQELFDKQRDKGLPLLLCNVTTHSQNYRKSYAHRISLGLLNYIYGPSFPDKILEPTEALKNPINQCPIDNTIDILHVEHNPTSGTYHISKLGTDLHVVRRQKKLTNLIKLANKSITDEQESKNFKMIGCDIASHENKSIASHGNMLISQHYLAKAYNNRGSHKTFDRIMSACKHLWLVAQTRENYYLAHHAKYMLANIADHPSFKKLTTKLCFLPTNQQLVRELIEQEYDLLSRDRALVMHAEQLEDSDSSEALKIYKELFELTKTPTKKAYATAKHAQLAVDLPTDTRIDQAQQAIAASEKYLVSRCFTPIFTFCRAKK